MGELTKGGGTAAGDRGAAKIESAVAGPEVEGLYGLLRGAVSHSPMSSIPPHPKNATMLQLPPFLSCLLRSSKELYLRSPVVEEVKLALEAPSSAVSQALDVAIPTHMAPLHLQLGSLKRIYKCQVEGCSEEPSTSLATICAHVHRDHLKVMLACPSCTKTFLNSDALRHHRKIHSSQ